jgi:hypothetical protein
MKGFVWRDMQEKLRKNWLNKLLKSRQRWSFNFKKNWKEHDYYRLSKLSVKSEKLKNLNGKKRKKKLKN